MSERGVACRRRTGEDMISLLPDHLLCQILSDVPTKTAVVTSVLSTRWRTIWLSTPVLDLHTHDFPNVTAFASFITWFLELSKGSSCLHKLKLALVSERPIQDISSESSSWDLAFVRGHLDPYYFMTQWIDNAVTRKVKHLDILYPWIFGMMPLSIYTCVTLVSLKIQNVSLADTENVSLPRLKTMHLENNIYATDALLEKLVSCPVLEDLTVVRKGDTVYDFEVLRVRSQSLKSLVVVLIGREWWYKACRVAVIDAPGLKYLSLKDSKFTSYVISSLSSSAKVDIDVSFDVERSGQTTLIDSSKRSALRSFFSMLSSVRDMTISLTTLECICLYLKHEPLPQFPYLIRLHAVLSNSDLGNLPNILESCPNLKSLVLELNNFRKEELLIFSSSAPECLRLSLECVEIRTPIRGAVAEIELVKYFLENSAVLKKIKMRLRRGIMNNESNICMQLLRLRRCSPCEVVVEELEDTFQGLDFYSELMNGCFFKDL